jgi:O-antigen/teichoic acid export membrane protein
MVDSGPRHLGDFFSLASGELLAKGAGFFAFAWLARRLGPESYGAVEVAVAVALIGALVVDYGLGQIGARAVALAPDRAPRLAASIPALRLTLAAASAIAVVAASVVLDLAPDRRLLVQLFALSLLLWPWNLNWLCQGLDHPALASFAQPLRMGVFALGVLFLVSGPGDLPRVGMLEVAAVGALGGYFLLMQSRLGVAIGLRFDRREIRGLLSEALPVGLGQLFWAAGHVLPVLLTAAWIGGEEVAWIGAAVRVEVGLHAFVWLYYFALYPHLVRAATAPPEELAALLRPAQSRIVWLVLPVAIAGTAWSQTLSRLAFGPSFATAGHALELALWALPVAAASGVSRFLLIAAGHQRLEMTAAAAGVAAVAACGAWAVPSMASEGAALALIAGGLVHWAVAAGLARTRVTREPGIAGAIVPLGAALAALLVARLAAATGSTRAGIAALALYAGLGLAGWAFGRRGLADRAAPGGKGDR